MPRPLAAAIHGLLAMVRATWAASRSIGTCLRGGGRIFLDSHAFDHAASISFFALLSTAPLLILVVAAAGYLAVLAGPSSSIVDGLVNEITGVLQEFAPVQGDKVRSVISALIEHRHKFGLFGGLVMLLGASMVFGALEHAMHDIFRVPRRRRFLASRAIFSVVLVATGCAVFLAHYAMTLADSLLLAFQGQTLDEWLRESALLDAALTYLPVPVGFLAALYAPGVARVRLRHALAGAAVFFVMWEVVREGFAYYVTNVARFGVLYGSLATPILLTLWIFYSANILLFAFACTAAASGRSDRRAGPA